MQQVVRAVLRSAAAAVKKRVDPDERTFVRLRTPRAPRRGRALLSYVVEPFLLGPGEPVPHDHTHHWESLAMARNVLDLGYDVDVISYRNQSFVPKVPYDLFIGARTNFTRIARRLPSACLKVAHLDTAHWLVNNAHAYARHLDLRRRRGVAFAPKRKLVEPNEAAEHADVLTILGNEFTAETYRYADKPIYRLPLPSCRTYEAPSRKSFASTRNRFVWFGSDGLVHKGLDIVLDAFAGLPDHHLTVCGPVARDTDFVRAYRRELYELSNVETAEWVDIESDRFQSIADTSLAVVYPSCSEGGGGSVLTCMHAGLLPVVTLQASVDVDGSFGVTLTDASVEVVRSAVVQLSTRPETELEAMAHAAWRTARANYTRTRFREAHRVLLADLLGHDASREPAPASTRAAGFEPVARYAPYDGSSPSP